MVSHELDWRTELVLQMSRERAQLILAKIPLALRSLLLDAETVETLQFYFLKARTREDPPRGTKTMSCLHTQKWSRVKVFIQWLGTTGCLALDRVSRAMVWRDKSLQWTSVQKKLRRFSATSCNGSAT